MKYSVLIPGKRYSYKDINSQEEIFLECLYQEYPNGYRVKILKGNKIYKTIITTFGVSAGEWKILNNQEAIRLI